MYPAQQQQQPGAPTGMVPNGLPQTMQTQGFQKVPLQSSYDPQFQPSVQNMNNQFGNMNIRPESPQQIPPGSLPQAPRLPPGMSAPSFPQFSPAMPASLTRPSHAPSGMAPLPRAPQFAPVQPNAGVRPPSSLPTFPTSAGSPSSTQMHNTMSPSGMPVKHPQPPQFANGPSAALSAPQHQPPSPAGQPQKYPQADMGAHSWAQPHPVNGHPEHSTPSAQTSGQMHMGPTHGMAHMTSPQAPMSMAQMPGSAHMTPSAGPTSMTSPSGSAPMASSSAHMGPPGGPSMASPPGSMPYQYGNAPQNAPQGFSQNTPQGFSTFSPPSGNQPGMQPPFGGMQPPGPGSYPPPGFGTANAYPPPGSLPPPNQFGGAPPPGSLPPSNQFGGAPQNQYAGAPQGPPMGMFPPNQPPPGQFPGAFPGGAPPMMNGPQYMGPGAPPMGAAPGYMGQGKKQGPAGGLTNDGLPSVTDVLERDMANNSSGRYESRLASVLPPLVTTKAQSQDMGNTVPELLRSSLYVAPATASLLKDSGIPFVLHMQPMAELPADAAPIPVVYHGDQGPVRCNRCKAYMSPYMKFIDGGRKFQCPFCFVATETPQHYFQYLDSEGRRVDMMQRPELCLGTYEFLATKDYCKHEKLPEPPAFIFMIDVSYRAISSGFVNLVCNMLRNELESLLPVDTSGQDSKLRVGFATFSDSVHFFNLKSNLSKPSMMTVNDFTDMFVPIVDGFLVRLEESGKMLDALLEYIPQIFANSRETDTILYPVIQSGMRALEAAGCPGKLFVFNFSLPVLDAPGKLKNREDRALLGTDKEKTLLKPQIPEYSKLGEECVSVGCCVDLFLFPNQYVDVATLGEVSRITGGQIYKYNFFQPDKDGNRFLWDLRHDLKRNIAFDAVMRVRTNAGIRPTDYFGNMFMPNTTEVHLAALDSEKAILAEIKHDDKLEDKSIVHIQVALLYTSLSAQRRVRVMNLALNASTEFPEMYRCAEIDVIMNFMMKNSLKGLFEFSPAAIREGLAERTTRMLVAYRKHCSSQTPAGQLVLPESLKLLPIYANCLSRSDIVSGTGSDVGADDRSWLIAHANSLPVEHSTAFLYPRLYVLNEMIPESPDYFRQIRCTAEKMQETGCYLLENSIGMFLWVGKSVDNQFLIDVFGVPSAAQMEVEKGGESALSNAKNPNADRIRRFIERTRASRPLHMRLTVVRQGDATQENWFRRFLVEDKGVNAVQQSYVDFIYYLYNQIRDELDK